MEQPNASKKSSRPQSIGRDSRILLKKIKSATEDGLVEFLPYHVVATPRSCNADTEVFLTFQDVICMLLDYFRIARR
jgi:hypothetical protein